VLRKRLGQRIFALRKWRGLSQEKLAEASDYSVDFISLVERGINAPTIEGCGRIADALKLELKDLFDFDAYVPECKRPKKKSAPHKTYKRRKPRAEETTAAVKKPSRKRPAKKQPAKVAARKSARKRGRPPG